MSEAISSNNIKPGLAYSPQRLLFPVTNTMIFMMIFGLIGFVISEMPKWILIGAIVGLGIGLLIEFGLGLLGGFIYRWRAVMAAILELILGITVIAPFIYMYVYTIPAKHTICCMETSGLGVEVEQVQIPVADGETLSGWFVPPAEKPGPVVMVLHGNGGDRTGSLAHARVLVEAGFGVLVYDQRASGESTGSRRSMGLYDSRDITPIIDWLSIRPEVDAERIGGVGLSLGAHILIRAAPGEPRLKAIWSDGLGVNGVEDVPHSKDFKELFYIFIEGQTYSLGEIYLQEKWILCKKLIPQIAPRPLMLVAGGLDTYETQFNRGYEPLLGENGNLWIIENAGHVAGLHSVPQMYKDRMIEFFRSSL